MFVQDLQGFGFVYYEVGDLEFLCFGLCVFVMMLMGGGEWVLEVFQWWLKQVGNGCVLILCVFGGDELQDCLYCEIGGIIVVQILVFDSCRGVDDLVVLCVVVVVDVIFIVGGDQFCYICFWKGIVFNCVFNVYVCVGKLIVGISVGLVIFGGYVYGVMDGGSIILVGVLVDLMGSVVILDSGFLQMFYLQCVVIDIYFDKCDWFGCLIVFVVCVVQDSGDFDIVGIGVDEDIVLCVEFDGWVQVYSVDGEGKVWVVSFGRGVDCLVEGELLCFYVVLVMVVVSGSCMWLDDFQVEVDYQVVVDVSDGEIEVVCQ